MEAHLVHGEGDKAGEPFELAPHEDLILHRLFEYDPLTRRYLHNKALIGWPKGSGKTEFVAALGLEHLLGPTHPRTASIPVAAVTLDQAAEIIRIAGLMTDDQPIRELLEVGRKKIERLDGDGRMFATSASVGANDGLKPSLLLCDEIHEWDTHSPDGEARHGVLQRGLVKRGSEGRQVNITTAGWSLETLAGAMYTYGCQVAAGEIIDPHFLFEWRQASEHWNLDDPDELLAAIYEANPAADLFWPVEGLVRSYAEHKLRDKTDEWIRYHLNRWVPLLALLWMDMTAWHARAVDRPEPKAGKRIVLGFDGSRSGDSTALVGATVAAKPHLFVVGHWERPRGAADWQVPVYEVEAAIALACDHWQVAEVSADPAYWQGSLGKLAALGLPVVEFPQSPARLVPACQRFTEAVGRAGLTHSGDARLSDHMANCRRKDTEFGTRIVKEHPHSKRHIDLSVAAVMANERAAVLALSSGGKKKRPRIW